ncbi:hypothetical protein OV079_15805 [Nannocystis pusilla]|uniref:ATPase AAA-type core domain-containing protein n=1 Tax=Nannocystis pusilla TaxID=889268 RepID=A0A9X3ENJ0_9BACT|nr:hypothetical protein [Nannocystis pusilla]
MLALAGDIAWRAARLNPHHGENAAKETSGVVLIDELDLHLHPSWQRSVLPNLRRVFPGSSSSPRLIRRKCCPRPSQSGSACFTRTAASEGSSTRMDGTPTACSKMCSAYRSGRSRRETRFAGSSTGSIGARSTRLKCFGRSCSKNSGRTIRTSSARGRRSISRGAYDLCAQRTCTCLSHDPHHDAWRRLGQRPWRSEAVDARCARARSGVALRLLSATGAADRERDAYRSLASARARRWRIPVEQPRRFLRRPDYL